MPTDKQAISQAVIRRLPRYLRQMDVLLENNISRVSSGELAASLGLTASQIRQDLNCFGGFGQQGYGYQTRKLRDSIADILGLDRGYTAILIGAGNLGRALLRKYTSFLSGFSIIGAFDINPSKSVPGCVDIYHMDNLEEFIAERRPHAAILTLPTGEAHEAARRLSAAGVRGIWNFTEADLQGLGLTVENVWLSDSLMTLCYRITEEERSPRV